MRISVNILIFVIFNNLIVLHVMAKKVDIPERTFSQEIEGLQHLPHVSVVQVLDRKEFSLSGNSVLSYKTGELAGEEYKRCLSLLERRAPAEYILPTERALVTTQMRLQPIMNAIFLKEMNNQDELKNIAVDTIREMFDIPEYVKLLPEFSPGMEEMEIPDNPGLPLTEEEKAEMEEEIQKRIILNAIVHGSAMHIWKSAHYIIKDQIDNLDPMLMDLYNNYTAGISWMMWMMPVEFHNFKMAQGFNKIEFDEEDEEQEGEVNITCSGINFPVLLHEVTKGAMDYLICHGIPAHYSEEQLEYYYSQADCYDDEIWHYLISPAVWTRFIEAAQLDTTELPAVIAQLAKLDYGDLTDVIQACIDSPEDGSLKLKEIINV